MPVNHCDPRNNVRQRQYATRKKGVKTDDFYRTKKGFYMDYDLKVAKGIPGSDVHINAKPWNGTKT